MEIKELLSNLGYSLIDSGDFYRANALYRGGNNKSSLSINKKTGKWIDFGTGKGGTINQLLELHGQHSKSIKLDTIREPEKKELKMEKIYPEEMLFKLLPHYDFFINRGLSQETCKTFKVGLAQSGKLYQRYIFPVYNEHKQIIGFSGRWHEEKPSKSTVPKYKHIGNTRNWIWPQHLNTQFIKEKSEIILVESPMCVLSLWEAGIPNAVNLFGLNIHSKLISFLIANSVKSVIIATNNEPDNDNIGNQAAEKIKGKLSKFINPEYIKIHLPTGKDFSDMLREDKTGKSIKDWYEKR